MVAVQILAMTLGYNRMLVIEHTPPKIDVIECQREEIVCRHCEGKFRGPAPRWVCACATPP